MCVLCTYICECIKCTVHFTCVTLRYPLPVVWGYTLVRILQRHFQFITMIFHRIIVLKTRESGGPQCLCIESPEHTHLLSPLLPQRLNVQPWSIEYTTSRTSHHFTEVHTLISYISNTAVAVSLLRSTQSNTHPKLIHPNPTPLHGKPGDKKTHRISVYIYNVRKQSFAKWVALKHTLILICGPPSTVTILRRWQWCRSFLVWRAYRTVVILIAVDSVCRKQCRVRQREITWVNMAALQITRVSRAGRDVELNQPMSAPCH